MTGAPRLVGTLGSRALGRVDGRGAVGLPGGAVSVGWWIGGDDRWYDAGREVAVRSARPGPAPVHETAMRITGGDARERVYGSAPAGDVVVIEIVNESALPFVATLVVSGAAGPVARGGSGIRVGRDVAIGLARPPSRWAVAPDVPTLWERVSGGEAAAAAPDAVPPGQVVALLFPVAHRTVVRAAFTTGRDPVPVDVSRVPDARAVARSWTARLARGMQVDPGDPARRHALDAARADALLRSRIRPAGAALCAVLEDWGFDDAAAAVWRRLGPLARRAARRRPAPVPAEADLALLRATRDQLVSEEAGGLALVPRLPPGWHGRDLDVRDAPTRAGTVSFALRWHGARPALLWEVRGARHPVTLRTPSLDPRWSGDAPSGEALLAAPAPGGRADIADAGSPHGEREDLPSA